MYRENLDEFFFFLSLFIIILFFSQIFIYYPASQLIIHPAFITILATFFISLRLYLFSWIWQILTTSIGIFFFFFFYLSSFKIIILVSYLLCKLILHNPKNNLWIVTFPITLYFFSIGGTLLLAFHAILFGLWLAINESDFISQKKLSDFLLLSTTFLYSSWPNMIIILTSSYIFHFLNSRFFQNKN